MQLARLIKLPTTRPCIAHSRNVFFLPFFVEMDDTHAHTHTHTSLGNHCFTSASTAFSRLYVNLFTWKKRLKKWGSTYIQDSTYNREFHENRNKFYLRATRGNQKTMKTTRRKIAVRQMMLGRQAACMCVSVDSSHGSCTYHIHKHSSKFNGIQRLLLFYMNLQVVFWGRGGGKSTYIQENTVCILRGKYGMHSETAQEPLNSTHYYFTPGFLSVFSLFSLCFLSVFSLFSLCFLSVFSLFSRVFQLCSFLCCPCHSKTRLLILLLLQVLRWTSFNGLPQDCVRQLTKNKNKALKQRTTQKSE